VSDDGSLPRGETTNGASGDVPSDVRVWRRSGSAAYVESDERVVVLDLDHLDLQPYVFEGSAAQVWACLDGDRSESEIVHDLAEAYDVPPEVVLGDVRQFIDRLRDLGLIVSDDRS
jgi:hypothetical protein